MSRLIEFKYPCPLCRFESGQAIPKPTLITPTIGWVTCPECECKLQIQATLTTTPRQPNGKPSLQVATLRFKQSKKHEERIAYQRERDAKRAAELKARVDDEGVVVLPPAEGVS